MMVIAQCQHIFLCVYMFWDVDCGNGDGRRRYIKHVNENEDEELEVDRNWKLHMVNLNLFIAACNPMPAQVSCVRFSTQPYPLSAQIGFEHTTTR